MKAALALLLLTVVTTQAFLFSRCKTDSDCTGGCCEHSFFNSRCVAKSRYLQQCSTTSCGCEAGLTCMKESEVTSVAIETHVNGERMVCERSGPNAGTTAATPAVTPS